MPRKARSRRDRRREDIMSGRTQYHEPGRRQRHGRGWSRRHRCTRRSWTKSRIGSGTACKVRGKAARLADEAAHGPRACGDATFIEVYARLAAAVCDRACRSAPAEALSGISGNRLLGECASRV